MHVVAKHVVDHLGPAGVLLVFRRRAVQRRETVEVTVVTPLLLLTERKRAPFAKDQYVSEFRDHINL